MKKFKIIYKNNYFIFYFSSFIFFSHIANLTFRNHSLNKIILIDLLQLQEGC